MPTNVGREDLQRLVAEGAQLVEVLPSSQPQGGAAHHESPPLPSPPLFEDQDDSL
jgi:hypothetical protein